MNIKTGIDIVYTPRIEKSITSQVFIEKVFHPQESQKIDASHLAGIIAAKEAIMKALGMKPGSWLDIFITYNKNGRPKVEILNKSIVLPTSYDISISHDGEYAVAIFVGLFE